MVKELEQCKAKLAEYEAMGLSLSSSTNLAASAAVADPSHTVTYASPPPSAAAAAAAAVGQAPVAQMTNAAAAFLGPSEAAASRSLLDLSQGYRELAPVAYPSVTLGTTSRTLGQVTLSEDETPEPKSE